MELDTYSLNTHLTDKWNISRFDRICQFQQKLNNYIQTPVWKQSLCCLKWEVEMGTQIQFLSTLKVSESKSHPSQCVACSLLGWKWASHSWSRPSSIQVGGEGISYPSCFCSKEKQWLPPWSCTHMHQAIEKEAPWFLQHSCRDCPVSTVCLTPKLNQQMLIYYALSKSYCCRTHQKEKQNKTKHKNSLRNKNYEVSKNMYFLLCSFSRIKTS